MGIGHPEALVFTQDATRNVWYQQYVCYFACVPNLDN